MLGNIVHFLRSVASSANPYRDTFQIFSGEEIKRLRRGGEILHDCLRHVAGLVEPGVTTKDLDRRAEAFIRDHTALPAFKGYRNFPATLCTSINDVCVHGIPGSTPLSEGDIIALDCGVLFSGLYTDACITVPVGKVSKTAERLLQTTERALEEGLKQVRKGAHTGDVSAAIHRSLKASGFDAMENLTGHGLGLSLHQFPDIPNCGLRKGEGPTFPLHTIVAIEPISTAGSNQIKEDPDKWALRTSDGSLSAHFEHTVLVTEQGCEILT